MKVRRLQVPRFHTAGSNVGKGSRGRPRNRVLSVRFPPLRELSIDVGSRVSQLAQHMEDRARTSISDPCHAARAAPPSARAAARAMHDSGRRSPRSRRGWRRAAGRLLASRARAGRICKADRSGPPAAFREDFRACRAGLLRWVLLPGKAMRAHRSAAAPGKPSLSFEYLVECLCSH